MKKTFLILASLFFVFSCGGGGRALPGDPAGKLCETVGAGTAFDTATVALNNISNPATYIAGSYCSALATVVSAEALVAGVKGTADETCQEITDMNAAIVSAKDKMARFMSHEGGTAFPCMIHLASIKDNSTMVTLLDSLVPSAIAAPNNSGGNGGSVCCSSACPNSLLVNKVVSTIYQSFTCSQSGVSDANAREIFAEVFADYLTRISQYAATKSEEEIKAAVLNAITVPTTETVGTLIH